MGRLPGDPARRRGPGAGAGRAGGPLGRGASHKRMRRGRRPAAPARQARPAPARPPSPRRLGRQGYLSAKEKLHPRQARPAPPGLFGRCTALRGPRRQGCGAPPASTPGRAGPAPFRSAHLCTVPCTLSPRRASAAPLIPSRPRRARAPSRCLACPNAGAGRFRPFFPGWGGRARGFVSPPPPAARFCGLSMAFPPWGRPILPTPLFWPARGPASDHRLPVCLPARWCTLQPAAHPVTLPVMPPPKHNPPAQPRISCRPAAARPPPIGASFFV